MKNLKNHPKQNSKKRNSDKKVSKQKIIDFFEECGYKKSDVKKSRYICLEFKRMKDKIFIGKGGHIREGTSIKNSKDVTKWYMDDINFDDGGISADEFFGIEEYRKEREIFNISIGYNVK